MCSYFMQQTARTAASPNIWPFTVLISDFNKELYELPEDDLKMDWNMLEHFKCF
jgi:hypothetical protein